MATQPPAAPPPSRKITAGHAYAGGAGALVGILLLFAAQGVKNSPIAGVATPIATPITTIAPTIPAAIATDTPTTQPPTPSTQTACLARGPLPDPFCTPGETFTAITPAQLCVAGYAHSVRNVPYAEKLAVYHAYGITHHAPGQYEVDHLISLELGGDNAQANLWPELALPVPGFHEKDLVENWLHAQVCSGLMPLDDAQRLIATNWLTAYQEMNRAQPPTP